MIDFIENIFRWNIRLLFEIIVEIVFQSPGYLIVKTFTRRHNIEYGSSLVVLFSLIFWGVIGLFVWKFNLPFSLWNIEI